MKDTIGLCLIGAGRAGMIHGRNFASRVPHAKMVAVSDTVEESARSAAGELGIDTWYTDYRQALENPAVDAVIVVTPTKFHHDIVIEAAGAGKHILCEKPMAMTREECQGMIDAVKKNKVKLQIGFMRRFDANFRRAKEIVDSGEIGAVVSVKSLTRGPSTPQEWMYDIHKSNGPLAEVNSHDIDTLRWFTGSEAASLYAMAGNYRCEAAREQYPDFYDTVLMNVRMKNGMMGNIDGAQGVQYGYDARVDILGTHGSLHIGGLMGGTTLTYTKDHRMSADVIRSWTNLFYEAYVNEDISFIGAIREDREPEVCGLDGMMAVDIVRAGNESIQQGQIIYLS
ncbi:Gfo/Idh/MocA family oxidoreductase [Treponema sp. TIM-1]|uniref:Gfo/Idh/MocA family oxidoreductase n=1 Tax=Treponema sp. TIM-1 TaxID=2898417 RepID=UPI00397FDA76